MTHSLMPLSGTKEEIYIQLLPQLQHLVRDEENHIANLANITAALKSALGFFWVGFYLVEGPWLVLGPFQGELACTRIARGKGVCGKAWEKQQVLIVDDVDKFDGHIACSSKSRSEIVVPVISSNRVIAVIDVDSEQLAAFDNVDRRYLTEIADLVAGLPGLKAF
ncbi:MAG: GAF domain-containing protein [Bacteroidales bacterium]|nr:GAF domain-containing protein [Bacteroidales bacterium]MDD3431282.1 GAF domain-containing protein [Bacteroidales bacterium]MDD4362384.1 GAF domain-containing protein [Bacteroidales bacterium]MDD4430141.1 GAF domain-containing protein [Bacteroidales bacterium]